MLVIAALAVVVTVAGAVVAWQLVGDLDRGVGQSLAVTGDVLVTLDDSFDVAEDALVIVTDGVGDAAGAVRSLGGSMRDGQDALDAATELTGGEVADALEAVEGALPAMQSAAGAIDTTLGALDQLPFGGLAYDPDQPLAATIGSLRRALDGLPAQLRDQASQVDETVGGLRDATESTLATAATLDELDVRLEDASTLVGGYAERIGEARTVVAEQQDALAAGARRARVMVVLVALMVLLAQFVPGYLGWSLLRGSAHPRAR
jgi:hypothetical protein